MSSKVHEHDPAPEPPDSLKNRKYVSYLANNRDRMDDPRYRCQGLPTTSTLMESLIKEVSDRVQGMEKFWNNPEGANQILAVKAAALSDDGRLLEAC